VAAGALLFISARWLYEALSLAPSAQLVLPSMYRVSADLLRFFVPILGGLGLFLLPAALGSRVRLPRAAALAASGVIGFALLAVGAGAFAERVEAAGGHLAYGPAFGQTYAGDGLDLRDVWQRHGADQCLTEAQLKQLCDSP